MEQRELKIREEATALWAFLVQLLFDTLKNLSLLAALSAIFFCANWLKQLGMSEDDMRHVQDLHFWLTYAALLWIGLVFLVKLVRGGLK